MSSTSGISSLLSTNSMGGFSGLMSGMDTDAMIKNMTYSIRVRIAKANQTKQLYQWRMERYQSVTSKIQEFSNKFISLTSSSSALTTNYYRAATTEAKGENADLVTVTGTSSASGQLAVTDIISTAKAASVTYTASSASAMLTTSVLNFDEGYTFNNVEGQSIRFNYEGVTFEMKMERPVEADGTVSEIKTIDDVVKSFNQALEKAVKVSSGETSDLSAHIKAGLNGTGDKINLTVEGGKNLNLTGSTNAEGEPNVLAIMGISTGNYKAKDDGSEQVIEGVAFRADKIETDLTFEEAFKDKNLDFTYNGLARSITITSAMMEKKTVSTTDADGNTVDVDVFDKDKFVQNLQTEFDKAFGNGNVKIDLVGDDTSGYKLSFSTAAITSSLKYDGVNSSDRSVAGLIGFEGGATNKMNMQMTIDDIAKTEWGKSLVPSYVSNENGNFYYIDINGKTMSIKGDAYLGDVLTRINNENNGLNISFLSTTNQFMISASETGAQSSASITGPLADVLFGTKTMEVTGSDAEIMISYGGNPPTSVKMSTNTFNIDGVNITLNPNAENNKKVDASGNMEKITFEHKAQVDDLLNNIKELVNSFNELTDYIYSEINTKYNRDYPPLTAEQRAEMTDKEIEDWEKTAKTGILQGDDILRRLTTELRDAFLNRIYELQGPSNLGIDLGISGNRESSANAWTENGRIHIDEDILRKAIETRPDLVQAALLGSEAEPGVMRGVRDVLDKYTTTRGEYPGALVARAGIAGNTYRTGESSLNLMIVDLEKQIENLERTRKSQETRFYKQFTALETFLASMSSQSAWMQQNLNVQ